MAEFAALLADEAKLNETVDAVFGAVDTDGSGQVDRKELKAAMEAVSQEANIPLPSEEEITGILQALDADNSGTLSKAEFKVLLIEVLKALSQA